MVVFDAIFETTANITADFETVIEVDKHFDPFPGPYSVIPATVAQTLATKTKLMQDDLTVEEIPYAETTNIYGTTIVIAS